MYERDLQRVGLRPQKLRAPTGSVIPWISEACNVYCAVRVHHRASSAKELTHLVVPILALSSRANESVKPRLDTIANDSMQTFVRRLVATEEI